MVCSKLDFKQHGIALIATLMVVLLVAILGTSVIQKTMTGKKNTSNLRDLEAALYAADSALRIGESDAMKPYETSGGFNPNIQFEEVVENDTWWQNFSNWSAGVSGGIITIAGFSTVSGGANLLAENPSYRIEQLPLPGGRGSIVGAGGYQGGQFEELYFRVSAKGVGRSENATQLLQSVVKTTQTRNVE